MSERIISGNVHTNMSDAQLFEQLLTFSRSCDACRVAHHECRRLPDCSGCETGFWLQKVRDHFGVK